MAARFRTSAFTLLEALLATTLMVIILGLLATIWQNAFRTAERLRSILLAHQRAREAMDQAEDILLQRSGAMPLIAQDLAPGRQCPFKLGGWQSKVHMDLTSMDVNTLTLKESTVGVDANGDGNTNGSYNQAWADAPPNGPGPKDAYSPGLPVKDATIGDWGWAWGMGRKFMWHSDIVRFDRDRSFLDQTGSPKPPAISYANIDTGVGYLDDVNDGLTSWKWRPILGRRYSANTVGTPVVTTYALDGPYRGVTIVPWVHKDTSGTVRPTPWLGMSHVFRVESGPSFFREPWSNGKWVPKTTGDYGSTTGGSTLNGVAMDSGRPLEPNWNFVTGANWNPTASDPAVGTPRPEYGITVIDNGGTRWRCEAPHLMLWDSSLRSSGFRLSGMVNSTNVNDNTQTWSTDHLFRGVQTRTFLTVKEGDPDARSALEALQDYSQIGKILTTQFSRCIVRTARPAAQWTTAPASQAGTAARGRWGSLTIPGWWNGSNTVQDPARAWSGTGNTVDGLTAGFPGAAPSGEETAGHPAWVAVDFGTVGGLERPGSLGFELVFTYAQVLR